MSVNFYTPSGKRHDYCESAVIRIGWIANRGHYAKCRDMNTGRVWWKRSNGRDWRDCDEPSFANPQ